MLLNCWTKQLQIFQVHRSYDVEGIGQHLMYNVFSCKCFSYLTLGRSNFKLCRRIGDMMWRVLINSLFDIEPKVKAKGKKAGICNGLPSTAALV